MENKDKQPLVSVIMATYNEPKQFIEQSICSILNQSYKNLELIVADDSTNKDTIQVIDKAATNDPRVKVIRKAERMGFVPSLNYALQAAKGELLARMDGDDISLTDRIEKQVEFSQRHSDIDVFGGCMNIIDENGKVVSHRYYPTTPFKIKLMFMFRSPFAHPTVMFKRSIIDEGFFYNPAFKKAEDIDFFMRLYKAGKVFSNLDDTLLNYRVVGNLENKRSKDQWIYNHKARKKFIASKPLFSIGSFAISLLYEYIPDAIVSWYYSRENRNK